MRRVEDARFLRGRGQYVDDLRRTDVLHVAFLRSTEAHARIVSVDLQAAREASGVIEVFDGKTIYRWCRPIRPVAKVAGYTPVDWPILALDRVRFVGEAVAMVVARDRYLAEDAAELIDVTYEPLHPLVDAVTAMSPDAILLHDEAATNVLNERRIEVGDVQATFDAADVIVRASFATNRAMAVSIEPRGCVASFEPVTQSLTLWTSTQVPHIVRDGLAEVLALDESRIRVVAPDVGGGFGVKGQLMPEEVAACVAARLLERPVKWIEDRHEHLLASTHALEHRYELEAAVQRDGRLLAMRATVVTDTGAYPVYPYGSGEGAHALTLLPGPYDFQDYACEARSVVTNKSPVAPYRGVSRVPANFATERLMDLIARRLELDPMEVRLRNLIRDDQFPYRTAPGLTFDSGQYSTALCDAVEAIGYAGFRSEQGRARAQGRYLGVGLSIYVESSAGSSTSFLARGIPVAGFDTATVRVLPGASIEVFTSAASQGQSHETVFGELVAGTLNLPTERVVVREGDTQLVAAGTGTFGSRSAVMAGSAALLAARQLRNKAIRIAAHLLEAAEDDITLGSDGFSVRGTVRPKLSWQDIAQAAYFDASHLPSETSPGLEATATYDLPPGHTPCSYGVHAAIVDVDPETGCFDIVRYVIVEDCGTMLNPVVVEGQVVGGLAQGIGTAAYEALVYDDQGQLLTGSLMDYLVPTAMEVPKAELRHLVTPSPYTLTGAKGMGEGGAIPPPAVLANAISDALQPFGVEITDLPLTPDRIQRAILAGQQKLAEAVTP